MGKWPKSNCSSDGGAPDRYELRLIVGSLLSARALVTGAGQPTGLPQAPAGPSTMWPCIAWPGPSTASEEEEGGGGRGAGEDLHPINYMHGETWHLHSILPWLTTTRVFQKPPLGCSSSGMEYDTGLAVHWPNWLASASCSPCLPLEAHRPPLGSAAGLRQLRPGGRGEDVGIGTHPALLSNHRRRLWEAVMGRRPPTWVSDITLCPVWLACQEVISNICVTSIILFWIYTIFA